MGRLLSESASLFNRKDCDSALKVWNDHFDPTYTRAFAVGYEELHGARFPKHKAFDLDKTKNPSECIFEMYLEIVRSYKKVCGLPHADLYAEHIGNFVTHICMRNKYDHKPTFVFNKTTKSIDVQLHNVNKTSTDPTAFPVSWVFINDWINMMSFKDDHLSDVKEYWNQEIVPVLSDYLASHTQRQEYTRDEISNELTMVSFTSPEDFAHKLVQRLHLVRNKAKLSGEPEKNLDELYYSFCVHVINL